MQSPNKPIAGALRMKAIEVVATYLKIFGAIAENAEGNDEKPVGQRNDRFANPVLACFAVKEGCQITVLPAGRGPCALA